MEFFKKIEWECHSYCSWVNINSYFQCFTCNEAFAGAGNQLILEVRVTLVHSSIHNSYNYRLCLLRQRRCYFFHLQGKITKPRTILGTVCSIDKPRQQGQSVRLCLGWPEAWTFRTMPKFAFFVSLNWPRKNFSLFKLNFTLILGIKAYSITTCVLAISKWAMKYCGFSE